MRWPAPRYEPRAPDADPVEWARSNGGAAALFFGMDQQRQAKFEAQETAKKAQMIKAGAVINLVSEEDCDSF